MPTIREATPADLDAAVAILSAAFADYPFTRHTIAADDHPARVARFQELLLAKIGLPHGRVWISDDLDAVAVWTTPASEGIERAFADLAPELHALAGDRAAIAEDSEAALQPHRPTTPTWFLATVGVRPDRQGRGLGRAVIEPGLRAAEDDGQTAYLETSTETNVALYRKLGFEVTATVDLPHNGPRTWAMRRRPPS